MTASRRRRIDARIQLMQWNVELGGDERRPGMRHVALLDPVLDVLALARAIVGMQTGRHFGWRIVCGLQNFRDACVHGRDDSK